MLSCLSCDDGPFFLRPVPRQQDPVIRQMLMPPAAADPSFDQIVVANHSKTARLWHQATVVGQIQNAPPLARAAQQVSTVVTRPANSRCQSSKIYCCHWLQAGDSVLIGEQSQTQIPRTPSRGPSGPLGESQRSPTPAAPLMVVSPRYLVSWSAARPAMASVAAEAG